MAQEQFTEAGQVGRNIRSGLSSAYRSAKGGAKRVYNFVDDVVKEYGQEPLLNLYPQAVNLTAATGETIAGIANKPVNLGRYPWYNIQTQFDKKQEDISTPETNQEDISEPETNQEEIPTITVSKPKRKAEKLYRVMYAGKDARSSEVYDTKEEADAALKASGGKGAVVGLNFSQKTRGGEILPQEEVQARKKNYLDQLSQEKQMLIAESERQKKIKALRSPQTEEEVMQVAANKEQMEKAWEAANKAKRAKDKESGAKFASWVSDVKASRASENALNNYNNQLGLLKRAYSQARQLGDLLAAYQIQEYIQEYQSGIPKEMGARKKFAESGALQERTRMLQQKMEEARQQAEKDRRLAMTNPDYNR